MNNFLKSTAGNIQRMQENQDGTLQGGYVSITGGRYRIIISEDGNPALKTNEEDCSGTTNTGGCKNRKLCGDTSNEDCDNRAKCLVIPTTGTMSTLTTYRNS